MDNSGSVTRLINGLRSADEVERNEAAQQVWQRFSEQLLNLARRHLDRRVSARADEEDVLQTMYKSLCHRLQGGQFEIRDRDDLWKLLITLTLNKTRLMARRHTRECRDIRRETTPAMQTPDGGQVDLLAVEMDQRQPDVQEAAIFAETAESMLNELDPVLRQVALWKLEGLTNEEIAGPDKLDCAVRTVERKLAGIRKIWSGHMPEERDGIAE